MGAADSCWMALPVPALRFDDAGRFAALNDAAQAWLNLSERSAVGLAPDDPRLADLAPQPTGLF